MSVAEITTAIKTTIESVVGIGPVHVYERWSRSYGRFFELMRDNNGLVNGWMISRKSTQEIMGLMGGINDRYHRFEIRGIYALDDENASESAFQSLVENICDAFRPDYTLGGVCQSTISQSGSAGIQVAEIDVTDFESETLYHVCTLVLDVIQ